MADKKKEEKPPPIQIITNDDISRGRYSNNLIVYHSAEEFVIDWMLNSPTGIHLVSRVMVSPGHIKRIIEALSYNLRNYEDKFGPVKTMEIKDQTFH